MKDLFQSLQKNTGMMDAACKRLGIDAKQVINTAGKKVDEAEKEAARWKHEADQAVLKCQRFAADLDGPPGTGKAMRKDNEELKKDLAALEKQGLALCDALQDFHDVTAGLDSCLSVVKLMKELRKLVT